MKKNLVEILEQVPLCNTGAPIPHVINGMNTVLIYLLKSDNPGFNGSSIKVIDPAGSEKLQLVMVKAKFCVASKFYSQGDSTLNMLEKIYPGIMPYRAHKIYGSDWIVELDKIINGNNSENKSIDLSGYNHYIFTFHDEIFECVAIDISFELVNSTMKEALTFGSGKINER